MKYVIFKTKWGYFGLAGQENTLCRTILPEEKAEAVETQLLGEFPEAELDKNFLNILQKRIIDYFEGKNIDFNTDIEVSLNGIGNFSRKILDACRNIKPGQTITYADLARKAGVSHAGRAAGNALARNPIPLIIPCHRVIRADGKLGGFSATGGTTLKKRLLQLEKHTS